jgi:Transposase DDE domain
MGIPAVWLFALLLQQGRHFLARIDGGQWAEVQAFVGSGLQEQVFTRPVGRDTRRAARALGVDGLPDTVSFRLVRVALPDGSEEILATSLLDDDTYPAADFAELYHARWSIEEAFKVLKHRLMVEQFSGESPEAIRQDFHLCPRGYAKLLAANLAAALSHSVQQQLPDEKTARYQPNLAYILAMLRLRLFGWLLKRLSADELLPLLTLIGKTLERKRPGRSAPRPKSRPNPRPRRQYK